MCEKSLGNNWQRFKNEYPAKTHSFSLTDIHYVEVNRHLCIVIVSYSIYATWCKCCFENLFILNLKM